MTAIVALYLWTTVGVGAGSHLYMVTREDWRYAGDFASAQHCHLAAKQLGLKTGFYRCVDTGRKS